MTLRHRLAVPFLNQSLGGVAMLKEMFLLLGFVFILLLLSGVMNSYSIITWLMFLTTLLLMVEE